MTDGIDSMLSGEGLLDCLERVVRKEVEIEGEPRLIERQESVSEMPSTKLSEPALTQLERVGDGAGAVEGAVQ